MSIMVGWLLAGLSMLVALVAPAPVVVVVVVAVGGAA